jgi:hypothetical protein
MELYVESRIKGMYEVGSETVELTPEYIDTFIEDIAAVEKLGFSTQPIADLITAGCPDEKRLVEQLMKRYGITDRQAVLVIRLPFRDVPLYFDKEEYPRQIERLKTMRRLLQEMKDVLDKD